MHTEFSRLHPELNLTGQNLADRKNVILKKGYLPSNKLAEIRREVGNMFTNENRQNEIQEIAERLKPQQSQPTKTEDLVQ